MINPQCITKEKLMRRFANRCLLIKYNWAIGWREPKVKGIRIEVRLGFQKETFSTEY